MGACQLKSTGAAARAAVPEVRLRHHCRTISRRAGPNAHHRSSRGCPAIRKAPGPRRVWVRPAATGSNGRDSSGARSLLVLEGDSRVGVAVVRKLLEHGDEFRVSTTVSPEGASGTHAKALAALQVAVHEQNYEAVATARPDVIVSCIDSRRRCGAVHERNQVFVNAALELGASTFVFISSVGAGDSSDALPGPAKETMKAVMSDKYIAERYLSSKQGLDHLVLRCPPLNDIASDGEVGRPTLTEDPMAYGWITPAGVADLVYGCLSSDRLEMGRTYSAVDQNTIFVTNPFLRPLEAHECVPFEPTPI